MTTKGTHTYASKVTKKNVPDSEAAYVGSGYRVFYWPNFGNKTRSFLSDDFNKRRLMFVFVLVGSGAGRCSFKVASCVAFPSLKIVTSCVAVTGPKKSS